MGNPEIPKSRNPGRLPQAKSFPSKAFLGTLQSCKNKIPRFRDSEIPRFLGPLKGARFLDSEIPRFLDSSIPRFLDSEIPRFLDSEIPRFRDSEIPRFRDSAAWGRLYPGKSRNFLGGPRTAPEEKIAEGFPFRERVCPRLRLSLLGKGLPSKSRGVLFRPEGSQSSTFLGP